MQKYAFKMRLDPGTADEHKRRHDAIRPEMLKEAGASDDPIHLDPETNTGVSWRTEDHGMGDLPAQPLMQRWWAHMADIMVTQPDNEPVSLPLVTVFHLE